MIVSTSLTLLSWDSKQDSLNPRDGETHTTLLPPVAVKEPLTVRTDVVVEKDVTLLETVGAAVSVHPTMRYTPSASVMLRIATSDTLESVGATVSMPLTLSHTVQLSIPATVAPG